MYKNRQYQNNDINYSGAGNTLCIFCVYKIVFRENKKKLQDKQSTVSVPMKKNQFEIRNIHVHITDCGKYISVKKKRLAKHKKYCFRKLFSLFCAIFFLIFSRPFISCVHLKNTNRMFFLGDKGKAFFFFWKIHLIHKKLHHMSDNRGFL